MTQDKHKRNRSYYQEESYSLSGMDVQLDILDLTKTNNNSVRLTLLVGNDDSKIEPEATTFKSK